MAVLLNDTFTKSATCQKLDLSDQAWKIVEHVIPVLKPFVIATEQLNKEEEPTWSQVSVLLPRLVTKVWRIKDSDRKTIRILKGTMSRELQQRFHLNEDSIMEYMHRP